MRRCNFEINENEITHKELSVSGQEQLVRDFFNKRWHGGLYIKSVSFSKKEFREFKMREGYCSSSSTNDSQFDTEE